MLKYNCNYLLNYLIKLYNFINDILYNMINIQIMHIYIYKYYLFIYILLLWLGVTPRLLAFYKLSLL